MPRSFLIKKKQTTPISIRTPVVVKRPWSSDSLAKVDTPLTELPLQDNISPDPRGPYDLSLKSERTSEKQEEMTNDSKSITPPPGVALISSKYTDSLKLESPGSHAMWHHRPIVPPYLPFNFPLYPFSRQATPNVYGHPGGQNYLVPPPLVPVSPSRATVLRSEQLSPCMPSRDSVSPTFYGESHSPPQQLSALHMESARKEVYSSMWSVESKEHYGTSLSPSPSTDSESSRENGGKRRRSDAPRYQCTDCSKNYSTYSGLSKHRQFHCLSQAKKAFSCKYCEKVYVSLGALKMHIRTHTLPCKCKLCGKAFSRPWLLQGHIRTHTGEKPFSCPHCNRAFADRSNLRAHLQTHSDVKKYCCKACSKTFSRMSLLLKHEDGGCSGNQTR